MKRQKTLPDDSAIRKTYPITSGCLNYFPAALAGVAHISYLGNKKHNEGQPLHHARGKSMDHGDCIVRHLMDLQDLLAADERAGTAPLTPYGEQQILTEASSLCWRALALSQELHEKFGAPLAPGAKLPPAKLQTGSVNLTSVAGPLELDGKVVGHFNDVGEFIPTKKVDYDWDV